MRVRLEDLSIAVRPRNPWEAMDLGLMLVRRNWRAVYGPWLILVLPFFVILNVVLQDMMWVAGIVFWWFKPAYDRIVLHVFSRAAFGDAPGVGDTLRAIPSLARSGLFSHLTLLRLDFARAFNLPVWQLEGLRGRARRKRNAVLQLRARSYAVWLTIACVHLEWVVYFSLFFLVAMLFPTNLQGDVLTTMFAEEGPYALQLATNFAYVLTVTLIEPFYVAAGFSLYLNRRTQLEGWDLELAFRRLGARLERGHEEEAAAPQKQPDTGRAKAVTRGVAGCLLAGLIALGGTPPGQAAENGETGGDAGAVGTELNPERLGPGRSAEVIEAVLAADEFQTTEKFELWLPKEDEEDDADSLEETLGVLGGLGTALAQIAEVILWLAVAAAVVLIIVYREKWLRLFVRTPRGGEAYTPPEVLFGLDLRPESLPDDVPGEAQRLLAAGELRQALSLLYRASLAELVNLRDVPLHDSHTEGDVLQLAAPALETDGRDYLGRLTSAWQLVAYAHRTPSDTEAARLCTEWSRHFGATPAPGEAAETPA